MMSKNEQAEDASMNGEDKLHDALSQVHDIITAKGLLDDRQLTRPKVR
jgi:hypothetical protein